MGAVLSHIMEDWQERPVVYASRILMPAEKNYSQLEKAGLTIIFGGRSFIIVSSEENFQLNPIINHYPLSLTKPKEFRKLHHRGFRGGHLH